MQLSVVIPTYTITDELAQMALDLARQVKPMCDELIIVEDGGNKNCVLAEAASTYMWHENVGDIFNSLIGMLAARGEYVAVINSDVIIHEGDLRNLCLPGRVVSPKWRQQREMHGFQGPFFVVPRTVLLDRQYGYLDVTRQGAGADYDYAYRVRDIYTWSDAVEYTHLAGRSHSEKRKQAR